jgi:2-amino-4-hydroxy-6-hydroxymethyldihydropteridine diphosphokinase
MHERGFVLLPLLEIAPGIVIPGRGHAADWLAACADQSVAPMFPPAAAVNA